MTKKEVFICDKCGKQSQSFTQGSDIPYHLGWRSLKNFEFKASSEFKHETILKQFCSTECMFSFIEKFIYDQEDELQLNFMKQGKHEDKDINIIESIRARIM